MKICEKNLNFNLIEFFQFKEIKKRNEKQFMTFEYDMSTSTMSTGTTHTSTTHGNDMSTSTMSTTHTHTTHGNDMSTSDQKNLSKLSNISNLFRLKKYPGNGKI